MRYIGAALRRREDERLVRGRGEYVSDINRPGLLHLAVLRSPHAHARLRGVDLGAAATMPGVVAVASGATIAEKARRLPLLRPHPKLHIVLPYPLATDKVAYVGQPVALVVAADRYLAEDALEAIAVDYEPLPAVVDPMAALEAGAPLVIEELGTNLVAEVTQRVGDVHQVFQAAALVVRARLRTNRSAIVAMEGRAIVAEPSRRAGEPALTVWSSTQRPHTARAVLASMLGLEEHQIRVIAPDVGGGFGAKGRFYPEEYLVPFMALELDRPVKWVCDRREDLQSTYHSRAQVHDVELALDEGGRILALRDHFVHDAGAYSPWGIQVPLVTAEMVVGTYKIPNAEITLRSVLTNKTPTAPYRGSGQPDAAYVIERIMDRAARKLGIDPVEIRQRNFIQPNEFPYATGLLESNTHRPVVYDCANHPELLRRALAISGYQAFRARQAELRAQGRFVGMGVTATIEVSGTGPFESALVRAEPSGNVVVYSGATSQGQSLETTLAQVCAERLGVPFEHVRVVLGDTGAIPLGTGSYASRAAVMAGNAVSQAAQQVRAKALQLAAEHLEAALEDLEIEDGIIQVRGAPQRAVTLAQVARAANNARMSAPLLKALGPGLEATSYFAVSEPTFSSAVHVATAEVDPATGTASLLGYVIVHDCGRVINPLVVEGQIVGGLAQGIGGALLEHVQHDEAGQILTGSLMDYLLPSALEVPTIKLGHYETLSPRNPEGIKGAGEGGAIPAAPAIASAVEDALSPFGATIDECPITPAHLVEIIGSRLPTDASGK